MAFDSSHGESASLSSPRNSKGSVAASPISWSKAEKILLCSHLRTLNFSSRLATVEIVGERSEIDGEFETELLEL